MRHSLALTATVLALAWAAPANAQMCGGGQTTGSIASTPASGGGMCGSMSRAAATDPMASPNPQAQQAGGCACCRNMAMMQGGGMGPMMGGGQGSAQPSQPSAPATPMPDMPGMTPKPPQ